MRNKIKVYLTNFSILLKSIAFFQSVLHMNLSWLPSSKIERERKNFFTQFWIIRSRELREICADGVHYTMMGIHKIIFILPICSFPLVNTYIHVKFKVQCDFLSHSKVLFYDFLFSLFFNVIKKNENKMKRNIILSKFISFFLLSFCVSFALSLLQFSVYHGT